MYLGGGPKVGPTRPLEGCSLEQGKLHWLP